MSGAAERVASVATTAPAGWDANAVDVPGGHVLQGTTWAAHSAASGWGIRYVTFESGRVALLITARQPPLPGFTAYASRGPVAAGDPPARVAARAIALAGVVREVGGTILAVDPELDDDPAYDAALAAAGFRPTEEIQPSRHRMVLGWAAETTHEALERAVAKQTRQRIRAARDAGVVVTEDAAGARLDEFAALTDAAAVRKGFAFSSRRGMVDWWRALLAAGRGRLWLATRDGTVLGGLLAYRQGGHLATAFSGDRADLRRDYPGVMHLLRWTAIESALAAGHRSIDLGGVDVRGARGIPSEGDPQHGLYLHKTSFGAHWVASAGAHERVLRPWVYRASAAGSRVRRALRPLRAGR